MCILHVLYIYTYCTVYFHVVASIIQNSSVVGFLGISPVRKHGCHGQNMVYGVLSSISYWESLLWVCVYIYIHVSINRSMTKPFCWENSLCFDHGTYETNGYKWKSPTKWCYPQIIYVYKISHHKPSILVHSPF